jgi:hypothetical protein
VAWGKNSDGQTNVPATLGPVVAVACGEMDTVALLADGTVRVWGGRGYEGFQPPPGLSNVVRIQKGALDSFAFLADGSIVTWNSTSHMPDETSNILALATDGSTTMGLLRQPIDRLTRAPVPQDFDGDHCSDLAAFDPATATWYIRRSSDGATFGGAPFAWGPGGTQPIPGDYDGDGRCDLALFEPATAKWYIRKSSDNQLLFDPPLAFGTGMVPAPGDYDGDGRCDVAVVDAAGNWFIRSSTSGQLLHGGPFKISPGGGMPLPADYDGDGFTDPGLWNGTESICYQAHSSVGITYRFGGDTFSLPNAYVALDYDGDGWTDFASYVRKTTKIPYYGTVVPVGTWSIVGENVVVGMAGAAPVAGDYDGDGRSDPAYFQPQLRRWGIRTTSSGQTISLTWPATRVRGLVPVDNQARINKTYGLLR